MSGLEFKLTITVNNLLEHSNFEKLHYTIENNILMNKSKIKSKSFYFNVQFDKAESRFAVISNFVNAATKYKSLCGKFFENFDILYDQLTIEKLDSLKAKNLISENDYE